MEKILEEGLLWLCKNDPEIDGIVRPRFSEIAALLEAYITEIQKYNPSLSLVGTNDKDALIIRHILDSLSPLGVIFRRLQRLKDEMHENYFSLGDAGSGAGFPGIPLAISLPQVKFILIERKNRRSSFLKNVKTSLNLGNIEIMEQEIEKIKSSFFSALVFRAFHPLEPKLIKKLFRLCCGKGFLAAYKGRKSKIKEEIELMESKIPGFSNRCELFPCPVPALNEERHLLVINKG